MDGRRLARVGTLAWLVLTRVVLAQPADPAAPVVAAPDQAAAASPGVWRSVTFGATLEAYSQYNWNRPPDRVIPLRAYDTRAGAFGLQQVGLVMDASPDVAAGRRYGLRVDLQFGQATDAVQGSAANEPRPDVYRHVWQQDRSLVTRCSTSPSSYSSWCSSSSLPPTSRPAPVSDDPRHALRLAPRPRRLDRPVRVPGVRDAPPGGVLT